MIYCCFTSIVQYFTDFHYINKFTNNGSDTKLGKTPKRKKNEHCISFFDSDCPFGIFKLFLFSSHATFVIKSSSNNPQGEDSFFSRTISVDRIYSIEL